MKLLYAILILDLLLLGWAFGQDAPPPPPDGQSVYTNNVTNVTTNDGVIATWITAPTEPEWQIEFEFSTNLTDWTAYPITVAVPFEHDRGYVRVVARKVER
jgi:hypothetical protein